MVKESHKFQNKKEKHGAVCERVFVEYLNWNEWEIVEW